jgi:hypothetical protein
MRLLNLRRNMWIGNRPQRRHRRTGRRSGHSRQPFGCADGLLSTMAAISRHRSDRGHTASEEPLRNLRANPRPICWETRSSLCSPAWWAAIRLATSIRKGLISGKSERRTKLSAGLVCGQVGGVKRLTACGEGCILAPKRARTPVTASLR